LTPGLAAVGGRGVVTPGVVAPGSPVRARVLEATYVCVARHGLAKATVEDVAREASLSRATVYRHFPGGRDELLREAIAWETTRFFVRLADAVSGTSDFTGLVEEALLFARRAIDDHVVLQKVLRTEPDRLLPTLTVESLKILVHIRAFLIPHLEAEPRLRPGVDVAEAAEYVARMFLSWIGAPGRWDLGDRDQVRRLVRTELLAGLLEPGAPG